MEDREAMKAAAAAAALAWVRPGEVLGVGTGSTVDRFLDAVADSAARPSSAVATSPRTSERLAAIGIPVLSLPEVGVPPLYVDGADAVDPFGRLIKGAGGALTMEKIVATASALFVCIVDESKYVDDISFSHAPVPCEVVPAAVELVMERLHDLGARSSVRQDAAVSGNLLVDIEGLDLTDPEALEVGLDAVPGVVECGVFALRRADVILIGGADGSVRTHRPPRR